MKVPSQLTPLKLLMLLMQVLLKTCVRARMRGVFVSLYTVPKKAAPTVSFLEGDSLLVAPHLACGVSTVVDDHRYSS